MYLSARIHIRSYSYEAKSGSSTDGKQKCEKWLTHTAKLRDQMGVTTDYSPWTSRRGLKLLGFPDCDRARDLVNMAWADRIRKAKGRTDLETLRSDYYVDLAQAVQRKPWGGLGTICQGTLASTCLQNGCVSM